MIIKNENCASQYKIKFLQRKFSFIEFAAVRILVFVNWQVTFCIYKINFRPGLIVFRSRQKCQKTVLFYIGKLQKQKQYLPIKYKLQT